MNDHLLTVLGRRIGEALDANAADKVWLLADLLVELRGDLEDPNGEVAEADRPVHRRAERTVHRVMAWAGV